MFKSISDVVGCPIFCPSNFKEQAIPKSLGISVLKNIVMFHIKNNRMTVYKTCSLYFLLIPPLFIIKSMVNMSGFNSSAFFMIFDILIISIIEITQVFGSTFFHSLLIYTFSLVDAGIDILAVVAILFLCLEDVLQAGFGARLVEGAVAAVCGEIGVVVGEYFGGFTGIAH